MTLSTFGLVLNEHCFHVAILFVMKSPGKMKAGWQSRQAGSLASSAVISIF